jgi:Ca-activated chloride channel homolog
MKAVSLLLGVAALASGMQVTQGTLRRAGTAERAATDCPLKRTSVRADIAGMLARVTVEQQFHNSFAETIEAVYVFPLPHDASVDRMTVTIGGRTVRGVIKRREEARAMFDAARAQGRTAGLLDQERPNIFTQSVTNIPANETVTVTISYVQTLQYEAGDYEFVFAMVVGPRYVPAGVPDKTRITPPLVATRPGHDITIDISLDVGFPLGGILSKSHELDVHRIGATKAQVKLRAASVIPNKDFVLRFDGDGAKIQSALLSHRAQRGGFFELLIQPPEQALAGDILPKELIFVLDTSGSMMGLPIEKAKETMKLALDALRPGDTFNLITFAGETELLFPVPVPATPENLRIAAMFLQSRSGRGGTEMMNAIRAALAGSGNTDRSAMTWKSSARCESIRTRVCSASASGSRSTVSCSTA